MFNYPRICLLVDIMDIFRSLGRENAEIAEYAMKAVVNLSGGCPLNKRRFGEAGACQGDILIRKHMISAESSPVSFVTQIIDESYHVVIICLQRLHKFCAYMAHPSNAALATQALKAAVTLMSTDAENKYFFTEAGICGGNHHRYCTCVSFVCFVNI